MSRETAAEYERLRGGSREDPGTAGGQGEEAWASLLRNWLPSGYHVVTGGRIIDSNGQTSPQIDIAVLDPSYPPGLLRLKYYMAPAVVAAFECKLALTIAHIGKAVSCAALLEDMMVREGKAAGEFCYGVLAHSHSWSAPGSRPAQNVSRALAEATSRHATLPGQWLDVLCIAGLYAWITELVQINGAVEAGHYGPMAGILAFFDVKPETQSQLTNGDGNSHDAGTRMITHLLYRLGTETNGLTPISQYLSRIKASGPGVARIERWENLGPKSIPSYRSENMIIEDDPEAEPK